MQKGKILCQSTTWKNGRFHSLWPSPIAFLNSGDREPNGRMRIRCFGPSGSVAANYTKANNAVSKPDFPHHIRIARKEASETSLWLRLLGETTKEETPKTTLRPLYKESDELTRILATILKNADH